VASLRDLKGWRSTRPGGDDPGSDREREARLAMVEHQLVSRGIRDSRVLEAMRRVPRHRFVPADQRSAAYRDGPLSIGRGQTISQPYIVALMTELLCPEPSMHVLEVGTGSGYQTAVLAHVVDRVDSLEILPDLARRAEALLAELALSNVRVRVGDGYGGWPERSPFDGIIVTAAPVEVPQPLLDQLAPGGRLVVPIGRGSQDLVVIHRTECGLRRRSVAPVRFVPMTGRAESDG
jgi:protein-L-isoaspartate(D-aspartate) O-methyltransferase